MPSMKMIRATIAVAFLGLAFCTAPVYATTISPTFYFGNTPNSDGFFSSADAATGDNAIQFTMDVGTGFSLDPSQFSVEAFLFKQSDLAAFPGFACLPYAGGNCIEYQVFISDADRALIDTSTNPIDVTIAWLTDTNSITQNPFILHIDDPLTPGCDSLKSPCSSLLANNVYSPSGTGSICFRDCAIDPADSGQTDNFSRFGVIYATPEPTTMVMLGAGVLGLAWRKRRVDADVRWTPVSVPGGASPQGPTA